MSKTKTVLAALAAVIAAPFAARTLRWLRAQRGLPRLGTRWDVVAGYRMFARTGIRAGGGHPPLVLVHGLSMSSNYLVPLGRRLARDYRVYAPDFPGYGQSPRPPEVLTIAQLADVLCDWMDHMGIRQAHLLANSMGCQIAVDFALRYPERALGLVLVGPSMDPYVGRIPRLLPHAVINMLFESPTFYPVLLHDYLAAGMRETSTALVYSMDHPMAERVQQVGQPALVVRGSRDWIVSQPWVEHLARLLPAGQLAVIQGGAHVCHYSLAERVEPVARAFLAEVEAQLKEETQPAGAM